MEEHPSSSEGLVLGQPPRLSCPVAPIGRPLEASILPNWTGDIATTPFYVYLSLPYLSFLLLSMPAH